MNKMVFNNDIKISDFEINDSSPVFIIGEAGVNHNGDIDKAKKLVDIAAEAQVNAVKFQSFKTENLILKNIEKAPYQKKTTGKKESQFSMLKKLELSRRHHLELYNYCKKRKIAYLTTPYDEESLDALDSFDLPAYKIASTDTTNLPFLKKIAKKGKPMILSTGMSYLSEIDMALREIYRFNKNAILLQCTANYPIEDEETNLNIIKTLKDSFDIIVGFSDHTRGVGAGSYAVVMGAKVIEKHFTIDKSMEGPDHPASLSPSELTEFVKSIRKAEMFLGSDIKIPTLAESQTRKSLQRFFVAKRNIRKGETLSDKNLTAKRTNGIGISPVYYRDVFGKPANKNYAKDEIISL